MSFPSMSKIPKNSKNVESFKSNKPKKQLISIKRERNIMRVVPFGGKKGTSLVRKGTSRIRIK